MLRDVDQPLSFGTLVLPLASAAAISADGEIELRARLVVPAGAEPFSSWSWFGGPPRQDFPGGAAQWRLVGHDVCDLGGISGLMNCGYSNGHEALAREWGPRLNDHHLFDDPEHAEAFRLVTNARVIEHAPFLVHELYRRERQ